MLILSQFKLSINSKKFFHKSFKAHQPKGRYEIEVKIIQSFGHKCAYRHNLNEASSQKRYKIKSQIMQLSGHKMSFSSGPLRTFSFYLHIFMNMVFVALSEQF